MRRSNIKISCISLFALFFSLGFTAYSQTDSLSIFQYLMTNNSELDTIRIETDWNLLIRKKNKEEHQDGTFTLYNSEGAMVSIDMKLRTRGNVRKEVCYYPPLLLNFKGEQLSKNGFSKYDKVKMVIQCRTGSVGEDYLFKELLAYRLFNVVSPLGYNPIPVVLEMYNDGKLDKYLYAFLLEEEKEYGDRLESKILRSGNINSAALDREAYLKLCFFQYMIGNTDWSIPNMHNLEMTKQTDNMRVVAVAYDFDYAGLVATAYAVPAVGLPISNVRQRFFMGVNVTEEEALSTAQYFVSMKEKLMEQCQLCPILNEKEKERASWYIEDFFDVVKDENRVKKTFVNAR